MPRKDHIKRLPKFLVVFLAVVLTDFAVITAFLLKRVLFSPQPPPLCGISVLIYGLHYSLVFFLSAMIVRRHGWARCLFPVYLTAVLFINGIEALLMQASLPMSYMFFLCMDFLVAIIIIFSLLSRSAAEYCRRG